MSDYDLHAPEKLRQVTPTPPTQDNTDDACIRIVVTGDNHLSAYMPRLSPTRQQERRKRLMAAFSLTIDAAIERRAHLYIQAGDLFDSMDPRNHEREFVAAELARLRSAGIPAFAVSGNHDTPRQSAEHGGAAPLSVYARLDGLHYFSDFHTLRPQALAAGGLHLAIAGLSNNPSAPPGADPLTSIVRDDPTNTIDNADLGILILHAAIEGHGFPSEDECIVRRSSIERLAGFHLIVTGHIHSYVRLSIADKSVIVCGASERMEFGQSEGAAGFAYLEATRTGLRLAEHVRIPSQPRHVITIHTGDLWPKRQSSAADSFSVMPANADALEQDVYFDSAQSNAGTDNDRGLWNHAPSTDAISHPAPEPPPQQIIKRIAPFCSDDAMVRLCLEGPLTREQYHALDLRRVWRYAQSRAFSFDLDEHAVFLTTENVPDEIERGERVAPREMLARVLSERNLKATTPEARALLSETQERLLARFDELVGKEASR